MVKPMDMNKNMANSVNDIEQVIGLNVTDLPEVCEELPKELNGGLGFIA